MIYYECSVSCSLHSFLSLSEVFGGLLFLLKKLSKKCEQTFDIIMLWYYNIDVKRERKTKHENLKESKTEKF